MFSVACFCLGCLVGLLINSKLFEEQNITEDLFYEVSDYNSILIEENINLKNQLDELRKNIPKH